MITETEKSDWVRSNKSSNGFEFPPGFIRKVREELINKSNIVKAGLDEFTGADKLAFYFLQDCDLLDIWWVE